MQANININLTELPKCKCEKGFLLPLYDTTREKETVYLKGWFCPICSTNYMLRSGALEIVTPPKQRL
jgi:hypothetical protein